MMKLLNVAYTVILLSLAATSAVNAQEKTINDKYDAQLAQKLGGDERGMKLYIYVLLKTGPNDKKITDPTQRGRLFKGHFSNMKRLTELGKLVLAGPYGEAKPKRGLLILNVATLAQADELVKTDPAVAAGIFDYELAQFYGSAALMQIPQISETLRKYK
jgi:uncharacterized protein YciI